MTTNLIVTDKETYNRLFAHNKRKLEPIKVKRDLNDNLKFVYYEICWRMINTHELILKKYYLFGEWVFMTHEDLTHP